MKNWRSKRIWNRCDNLKYNFYLTELYLKFMGNTGLIPQIIHSNYWIMIKQLNHPLYGPIKVCKNS